MNSLAHPHLLDELYRNSNTLIRHADKPECSTLTHCNLNLFFESNNMAIQNSRRSGTPKTKVTSFGLMKELIFWPAVLIATAYSIFAGPDPVVMLLAFFLAATIVITAGSKQQRNICLAMVAFGIVNGWYVLHPASAPQLYEDPRFWIANRLTYAVGIAVFVQPLFGNIFQTERGKTRTIVVAALLMFLGFVLYTLGRPENLPSTVKCVQVVVETLTCQLQREPIAWYTSDLLWDDICIGAASGLLVGALTAKTKKKA